uniref:Uncharacterized protein n=1 Tax=Pseudomonas phage HRDY3 TaxID=3236930 RepID=A0AB39CE82_9VIRU
MGDQTEQILEETGEESSVDISTWRVTDFALTVNGVTAGDPRLSQFTTFVQRLVASVNDRDSEMVVYPTRESTLNFLEVLETQVLDKYKLVFMWTCEIEAVDIVNEESAMHIQLYPYDHAEIFGYKLQ